MKIKQEISKKIRLWLNIYLGIIGIFSLIALIANFGFYLSHSLISILSDIITIVILAFILQEIIRWFLAKNPLEYLHERWFENLLALLLLVETIFPHTVMRILNSFLPNLSFKNLSLLYLSVIEIVILMGIIIKALRYSHLITRINLHPGAILSLSFAVIILSGAFMLMLPKSTVAGGMSFVNALFTSTSAVCVTGLIVVDTAAAFTFTGKVIIMLLIQVGGLGIMTLTTFFILTIGGSGISYKFRVLMKDLLSNESINEVTSLLFKIASFTFLIELIGAISIYYSIGGGFLSINPQKAFIAIFHSISAFCNAGFSLFSNNLMDSYAQSNYLFTSTIMLLIVLGGLGFTVLSNIAGLKPFGVARKKIRRQLSISSKVVIITTLALIFTGMLMMFITENYSYMPVWNFGEKLYHALFQSVSARTAGFNTLPIDRMTAASAMILIVLMWIGASPGSTGGGIKTTTFAVMALALYNYILDKDKIEIFHREIDRDSVQRAFLTVIASLFVLGLGSTMLVWLEPDKDPLNLIFEATSALGTVGLSRNVTYFIGSGGKVVLILLMYIGRIGVLTFFLAFYKPGKALHYSVPKESISIG
ncbi:MAG: hypothetical protein QG635_2326 [Bacteroidota bacterium]|nr:hypothetical protein [Bacteroidota bacterium]